MLPDSSLAAAQTLAERIGNSIEQRQIKGEWQGTINPTISLGVATLEKNDTSIKALYRAKENGRNQVCTLGSQQPVPPAIPSPAQVAPGIEPVSLPVI